MTAAPVTVEVDAAGRGQELVVLGFGQLLGWGAAFYTFSATLAPIAAHTGWSATTMSAGFTAGQLLSAVGGPGVGTLVARRGPRPVFATSAVLLGGGLAAAALAPSAPVFAAVLVLIGAASAGLLLLPAFAAVAAWFPRRRLRGLSYVSTAAAASALVISPLVGMVVTTLGWRAAYAAAALVCLAVLAPLYLGALRRPWPASAPADQFHERDPDSPRIREVARRREFWLLSSCLAASALVSNVTILCVVPLALEMGLGYPTGIAGVTANGAGAVVGRAVFAPASRAVGHGTLASVVFLLAGLQTAALGLVGSSAPIVVGLAAIAGLLRGAFTLFQGTFAVAQWGPRHYSILNSWVNATAVAAMAVSALLGTWAATALGSYRTLFVVLAVPLALTGTLLGLGRNRLLTIPLESANPRRNSQ